MADGRPRDVVLRRFFRQLAGDERGSARDRPELAGTDGSGSGTSGPDRRDLIAGWLAILAFMVAATIVNGFTALADNPHAARWEPWVWEITSAVLIMVLLWLPWLSIAFAPPERLNDGWPGRSRFAVIHLASILAFSAVHVSGMTALRRAVYRAFGETYGASGVSPAFIYELRKDALTYTAFAGVFWLTRRLRQTREAPLRPVSFDIRDGPRLIRAPVGDILAATSAGNYVEFLLADGRRPLMRATLAAVEGELGRFGFVRTHRSWLVNTERMTGLTPAGSGDWSIQLGSQDAPLSRRYPEALERLQRGG